MMMKYIEQSGIYYTESAGSQYPIYCVHCHWPWYISVKTQTYQYIWTPRILCTLPLTMIYNRKKRKHINIDITIRYTVYTAIDNALYALRTRGSYVIKDFGTLPLIFSTSKYFRWKFQPCPSFYWRPNIPDKLKRDQLRRRRIRK